MCSRSKEAISEKQNKQKLRQDILKLVEKAKLPEKFKENLERNLTYVGLSE